MQIQNALITGSFSYNGADLSNITSSNAYSASLSIRTTSLESTASSLVGASSSFSSRTTQVERTYASTGSNTFTGVQNFSNTCNPIGFNSVASVYTAGGLQVTYDSYFSSSVFVNGNLTVFGTQSVVHVSSSQFNIGTNIITVNTSTPSIRYGGLSVYDSGSTGLSGSIFWDSEANHWIYANASGSGGGDTYSGGMFISGPRNSQGLGCEQGTTSCMLLVGQGGDHLTSSLVYHSTTCTNFYSNALFISSSGIVGIGTSNVGFNAAGLPLVVGSGIGNTGLTIFSGVASAGSIHFADTETISGGSYAGYINYVHSTNNMQFGTNCSDKMTILSSGYVGIGATCPTEILHLNNTCANGSFIRFQNTGGSGVYIGGRCNDMELYAGGAERAVITSCGNIGIGVKPATWTLLCAVQIRNVSIAGYTTGNTHIFYAGNNWYYSGADKYITNGFASLYSQAEGDHVFYNASCNTSGADAALTFCERMRITSCGNVLVRASTASYPAAGRGNITIGGATNQSAILSMQVGGVDRTYLFSSNTDTYIDNASGTGNVVVLNGTGGVKLERNAISWISNSDERLKNINSNIENALDKVLTLRAVNFSWKEDEANKENLGLIAQDVEKVFPQVVNKSKLAKSIDSNNDDETEYLGIRYTELVPVLVKAIQELKCENNTFKTCLGIS